MTHQEFNDYMNQRATDRSKEKPNLNEVPLWLEILGMIGLLILGAFVAAFCMAIAFGAP